MMTDDDIENCRFEPNVGKQDPRYNTINKLGYFPPQEEGKTWVDKFGKNFQSSNPEVFKKGILKKAIMKYNAGHYAEAISTLAEGFNFVSIKQHYIHEENERQRKLNKARGKSEEKKKELDEKKKKAVAIGKLLATTGMSAVAMNKSIERKETEDANKGVKSRSERKKARSVLNIEAPDQKTHLHAEDFKNKKILPLIEEAWALLNAIKKRQNDLDERIDDLEDDNTKEARRLRKQEADRKVFKCMMCPLGENCPKDKRQRWPSSSIRTTTQFGKECLFAHNVNEIFFREYTSAVGSTSKKVTELERKKDNENAAQPWIHNGIPKASHNKLCKDKDKSENNIKYK